MHCTTIAWAPPGTSLRLDTMWEDRKCLFVDLLGWDVPTVDGRYEIDQFDGAEADYLVAVDEHGGHAGSLRLLASVRPHILADLFACLCEDPVPRGADVFEITRLCLPARHSAAQRREIRNQLISAMVDHALASGIVTLTGVVTARFREEILAMGWQAEPLGAARRIGGALLGAFAVTIDRNTSSWLAATGIYQSQTLLAAHGQAEIVA